MNQQDSGFVRTPQLHVVLPIWHKLMAFVQLCPTEINGFGLIRRTGDSVFVLDDVFILDQLASPASVEVEPAAIAQKLYELTVDEGNADRMRLQWHSHVRMAAYFSATDHRQIESYPGDWMISLVTNVLGEWECRLDVFKPFRVWSPVEINITLPPADIGTSALCREEIARKVRTTGIFRPKPVKTQAATQETSLWGEYVRNEMNHES